MKKLRKMCRMKMIIWMMITKKLIKYCLLIIISTQINYSFAADLLSRKSYIITEQQWSVPKNVQSILKIPALRNTMKILSAKNTLNLLIRYPGGDTGVLWATELKAWIVALGLDSTRIELQSGSAKVDKLELLIN